MTFIVSVLVGHTKKPHLQPRQLWPSDANKVEDGFSDSRFRHAICQTLQRYLSGISVINCW